MLNFDVSHSILIEELREKTSMRGLMSLIEKRYTKEEFSWILQDWANSVYSLMITTAIFPLFFKSVTANAGISSADSTAYLGYANSLATFAVSIMAPVLGALADYKGYRTPMFTWSTLLGVFSVLGMMFVENDQWILLLVLYTLSAIGYSASNIFYDSSIMDVTTFERMDRISAAGYGYGYIGSVFPFILFMMIMQFSGLNSSAVVIAGFFITAAWWFGFTIPYWSFVKQKTYIEKSNHPIKDSFSRLFETVKRIGEHKYVFIFLIAYFFYIDGVGTIIKMATAIGSDMGLDSNSLIVILLIVQIVAFPFSLFYGYLAKKIGNKNTLFVGIGTYIAICVMALGLKTYNDFLLLAILIGTAQGGVQSLSRSLFGQLIPANRANEFFGFYNIFGKFSSILGTTLLGITAQMTGNSLDGVFSLIALFIIGTVLLLFVKIPDKKGLKNEG